MTEKKSIDELVEGEDFYSDMFDTLGTEDSEFGLKQVKEKIKGLLDGGYIQNFNDMELVGRVQPKENRFVMFDSNQFHSSSVPTQNQYRVVVNFIFKMKESK